MPTKLTKAQQRRLLAALPPDRRKAAKHHARAMHMAGSGIGDILSSMMSILGPVVKEVGPTVLKEYIMPWLKKKMEGRGLSLPGTGLRLAGQGKKRHAK